MKQRVGITGPIKTVSGYFLGYNTNGFAHHSLDDALTILAQIGYRGIALTIDHQVLNPFAADFGQQQRKVQRQLETLGLRSVIETGARYLLDPRKKHFPTLVSARAEDRARRVDFLKRAIDIAQALQSDCVSLWSGSADDDAERELLWHRLTESLVPVIQYARLRKVVLAFEPEPGMFVECMAQFAELLHRTPADRDVLRLTLDVGHLQCQGETPLAQQITKWGGLLSNVHLEDMRRGVHEHLMFGQGEIEFPPVLAALKHVAYEGGIYVELSRHSHEAPQAAQRAYDFLTHHLSSRT